MLKNVQLTQKPLKKYMEQTYEDKKYKNKTKQKKKATYPEKSLILSSLPTKENINQLLLLV